MKFVTLFSILIFLACSPDSSNKQYDDLPFSTAKNAKEYADIVLKSIRTNRVKPLIHQFSSPKDIEKGELRKVISAYSSAMIGRDDWEFRDVYEESKKKVMDKGFDYAWLEPKGRLGLQIYILPNTDDKGKLRIDKIEFRSRLDALNSVAFPTASIEDYKKLNFNWDKYLSELKE